MKIVTYEQAVHYLESFIGKIRFRIDPEFLKHHDPLERMRVLLSLLGNPQEKFKSVLVGGTSGKGSTAYLISHILTTAGYKTGLTISPHLQKINERLQVNGKSISDEKFTQMIGSIVQTIELMKRMKVGAPSYFEILIAMAFLYFACPPSLRSGAGRRVQNKVDIAIVEVGMGGEYDATNTLYPLIAVLTNVSLDHTNVLGGTVQKIARTKVGIIKGFHQCHPEFISGSPGRRQVCLQSDEMLKSIRQAQYPEFTEGRVQHDKGKEPIVVTGVKQLSVIKIVEDRCREVGAKLYRLHKDFGFKIKKESLGGALFDVTMNDDRGDKLHALQNLQLALLGRYQVENASLAIDTVLQLRKFGFRISEENIKKALKTAFFPGRFEVIPIALRLLRQLSRSAGSAKAPRAIILDGAHNPTKMKAFLSTLKKLYPRHNKIFIVAFKFDKDVKTMLKQILEAAGVLIVTEFKAKTDISTNASMEISNLKSQISNLKYNKEVKIIALKNSKIALDKALGLLTIQQFNNSTIIVVTGSLYLVGEIRNML